MGKIKKVKDPNRLTFGQLLGWSTSGTSAAMQSVIIGFFSIYCSTILGLEPALVGTLLLATKIFDCFTDLLIGYLIDNTNTRFGRGRPYDLCIIGTWLTTLMLFSCPPEWATVAKCIWVVVVYTLMNSGFISLYYSAQTSYLVRAFNNNDAYVKINAYAGLIYMIGGVVATIGFPILMGTLATSAKGWQTLILIFMIPGLLLGAGRFLTIKEKYNVDVKTDHVTIKELIDIMKQNKFVWIIAFIFMVYQLVANMGVNTYYFTYVVGDVEMMGTMGAISMVMVPVMLIFPPLLKKVSIDRVISWGFWACVLGCVVNWFALDNFALLLLANFLKGVGVVPMSMMAGLLTIECGDYNEWKGLPRMDATLGIMQGLAGNVGNALGSFVLGICLQVAGFITTVEGQTVTQPDSAVMMIRLLCSFIPLALYVICILVLKKYTLSKDIPQIRKELDDRRAARAAEAVAEQ